MARQLEFAEVRKELRFEAAHLLPQVPLDHQCRRLHGHSFRATVVVSGPIDPKFGWVVDFADVKKACQPLLAQLDHNYLNEIEGLENPTGENIARWMWERLVDQLPLLTEIRIQETCTASCVYRGPVEPD